MARRPPDAFDDEDDDEDLPQMRSRRRSDSSSDWRGSDDDEEDYEEKVAPRRSQRRTAQPKDRNPEEPGRKQMTIGGVIWFILTLPFQVIGMLTKGFSWVVMWPLRIFLSFAFVGLVVGTIFIFIYGSLANRYDVSEIVKMPERTIVLDRKNREIGRLHGENRKMLKLEEVPPIFIQALLLREDSRFYSHGGVDWIGVGRAINQVFRHSRATQGASTLTMQLAKTTYQHVERNIHSKFLEIALAHRIEATFKKNEILQAYINRVFFGHTFLGLSAAARGYFNKAANELSISECALLAGIICGPNEFSPYKNLPAATEKRNTVLTLLLNAKKITAQEYEQALKEPIITQKPISRSEENYALDLIRRELDIILEDENIRLGGLVINTTLDLDLQNASLDAMNKRLEALESRKGYPHQTRQDYRSLPKEVRENKAPTYVQAATVVIDSSSGALLVVIGGRDGEESRFNRAIQARRQVGSLFKPFVYTAFFEKGYSPDTVVSDNRIGRGEIHRAGTWSPRNADGRYLGNQAASFGLVKSRNTMSVRVGNAAGLDNVIQHAQLAGFQGKIFRTPAMFLGTWEASPLDVASAYTVFANGGVRPTPYIIENIADNSGQKLFYSKRSSRRAYTPQASAATSKLLQQVTKPGGTAGQTSALGYKAPCGGKTGTTNAYKNAWFAGFGSNLTAVVWVGLDTQKTIVDRGYGGTLALPIWVDIMVAAGKEGYPQTEISLVPKSSSNAINICRESGLLAHSGCRAAQAAYIETMPGVKPPSTLCERHAPLAIPIEEGVEEIPTATPIEDGTNEEEPALAIPVDDNNIPLAEPVDNSDIPTATPVTKR